MKKTLFILISIVVASSCCRNDKSHQYNDLSMDFFGDGVYVNEVLCIEEMISLGTIAKPGKSPEELRDFFGFIMPSGILYIVIDTRDFEGGLTPEMLEDVNSFKIKWAAGEYIMYERYVYPIWMVYGNNPEQMEELNGYYKGAGWHIYNPDDPDKQFFTAVSSLNEVDIYPLLPTLANRPTRICD